MKRILLVASFLFNIFFLYSFLIKDSILISKFYEGDCAWADYENDGDLDLFVIGIGESGSPVSALYINDGGSFGKGMNPGFPAIKTGRISLGDFDGDGFVDVAVTGNDENEEGFLGIYKNNKLEGGKYFVKYATCPKIGNYSSCVWSDIDSDGDLDLLATGFLIGTSYMKFYFLENKVNEGKGFSIEELFDEGFQNGNIACADYNNDGWIDIAVTGNGGTYTSNLSTKTVIYKNLGYGDFDSGTELEGLNQSYVSWFDYDSDGDMDLALCGYKFLGSPDKLIIIYENQGAPDYNLVKSTEIKGIRGGIISWGDYNNDGYGDFFAGGESEEVASSWIYSYDGTKFKKVQSLIGLQRVAGAWADYDNDGDLDLFYCGQDTTTNKGFSYFYYNDTPTLNSPPSTPSNPVSSYGLGILNLKWDASSDDHTSKTGLNYCIRVGTISLSSGVASGVISTPFIGFQPPANYYDSPGIALIDLPEDTTYFWQVRAIDSGFRLSSWSEEKSIFLQSKPPVAISNLTALPGSIDGEIILKWTAPGDDGTVGRCLSYDVRIASISLGNLIEDVTDFLNAPVLSQSWEPLVGGHTESRSITGLTPGVTFYFGIRGYDSYNYGYWEADGVNSNRWTYAQDLVPSSPTWSGITPGDQQLKTEWNENPEIDIDKYYLEMSTYSSSTGFNVILSTSKGYTVYTITGLNNFTTYYFRIKCNDWTGHVSPYSEVKSAYPLDTTPPEKITDLTSTTGSSAGEIFLLWTSPGDSEGVSSNTLFSATYQISFSTYSFDTSTSAFFSNFIIQFQTQTKRGLSQNLTVTGLYNDTTYFFRIRTGDEVPNWSEISDITYSKTKDTVPPQGITDLYALTGVNPGEIEIYWTATGDNISSGKVEGGKWKVEGSTKFDFSPVSYSVEFSTSYIPLSRHNYTITGLIAGLTYYIRIYAGDEVPNYSVSSNTASAKSREDEQPPDVYILTPQNGFSYGKIETVYGTSLDDYGGVKKVEVNILGNWNLTTGTTSWSFDVSTYNFVSGNSYTVLTRAEDFYGNITSTFVVFQSSVTFYFDNIPPLRITDLYASTGTLGGSVILSWTSPYDLPDNDKIGSYILKYSTFLISDLTNWWNLATSFNGSISVSNPGIIENLTVSGLILGLTYYFGIKSIDDTDFYYSTSSLSNVSYSIPRYSDDIATYFTVEILTDYILKGLPLNFTVSCYNPHTKCFNYNKEIIFQSNSAIFYPISYNFETSDRGEKEFLSGVTFNSAGTFNISVYENGSSSVLGTSGNITVVDKYEFTIDRNGETIIIYDGNPSDSNSSLIFSQNTFDSAQKISVEFNPSEINAFNGENPYLSIYIKPEIFFNKAVKLKLLYNDRDDNGTIDEINELVEDMSMFYYDGVNWRKIPTSLETGNLFSGYIYKGGLYAVFKNTSGSFSISESRPKRKIFTPNGDGKNDYIEFTGLLNPFKIKIFSISGVKVREIEDIPAWDGKDSSGKIVPSGIYIYVIEKDGRKEKGVIVVAK